MAESIFNESGELVDERERALQTICHLIDESGAEPGPDFWLDVERMHIRELYVRIRELAKKHIAAEHAKWSDLVVLALEEMEDRTVMGTNCRADEILAAIDRMKADAIRTVDEGYTVDVIMNHIYGTHRRIRAAVNRDSSRLTVNEIKLQLGSRADHANN